MGVKQKTKESGFFNNIVVHDSSSDEDSSEEDEREDGKAHSGVQQMRKLHATSKKLQRTVMNEEARVKTLTTMLGGFPLEPSHFEDITGTESDKALIQQYMDELIQVRSDWWNSRQ